MRSLSLFKIIDYVSVHDTIISIQLTFSRYHHVSELCHHLYPAIQGQCHKVIIWMQVLQPSTSDKYDRDIADKAD